MPGKKTPVALARCDNYDACRDVVFAVMDNALPPVAGGLKVLVKPNLLQDKPLACSNPQVVKAVCQWLLAKNAKAIVADSPGFGRADKVGKAIGLNDAIWDLGLKVEELDQPVPVELASIGGKERIKAKISRKALESDMIISVPRIKAHRQMRLTLGVKNCYGCAPGLCKAIYHTQYGKNADMFADLIAAIWEKLPPVMEVADGIMAMHVTGPSKGEPYNLGLLGASPSAPALDKAIMEILHVGEELCPVACAIKRRQAGPGDTREDMDYPLLKPDDFNVSGFITPETLASASFNPLRMGWSIIRRIAKSRAR